MKNNNKNKLAAGLAILAFSTVAFSKALPVDNASIAFDKEFEAISKQGVAASTNGIYLNAGNPLVQVFLAKFGSPLMEWNINPVNADSSVFVAKIGGLSGIQNADFATNPGAVTITTTANVVCGAFLPTGENVADFGGFTADSKLPSSGGYYAALLSGTADAYVRLNNLTNFIQLTSTVATFTPNDAFRLLVICAGYDGSNNAASAMDTSIKTL